MTLSRNPRVRQCELFRIAALVAAVIALVVVVWDDQAAQVVALASITFALLSQWLPVYVEHRYQNVERVPFVTDSTPYGGPYGQTTPTAPLNFHS